MSGQAQKKLIIRRKEIPYGMAAAVKIYLNDIEIATLKNGEEKRIDIEQGNHSIYAKLVAPIGSKTPTSEISNFTVHDYDVVVITYPTNMGVACETDALPKDLSFLDVEKERLERRIKSSGMKGSTIATWIGLFFLVSCFLWYLGYAIFDAEGVVGICVPTITLSGIGIVIWLAVSYSNSNKNKVAFEDRLDKVNLEIAKQKKQQEVSGSAVSKKEKTSSKINNADDMATSNTENLEKELRRIKKLLDDELITQEEYQELRKKIMKLQ
ncbi:MAG: hypothetical protein KPEEDBHJ_03060 [Anaerolineales bacterium]|nr:hypothetical protein [Anaerolineales bacterium]